MKHKIVSLNILILVVAMLLLFIAFCFNTYNQNNLKQEANLISENNYVTEVSSSTVLGYRFLNRSLRYATHIYMADDKIIPINKEKIETTQQDFLYFKKEIEKNLVNHSINEPIKCVINGKVYLAIVSTAQETMGEKRDFKIFSFIEVEDFYTVFLDNMLVFFVVLVFVTIISILFMIRLAKKLTDPLIELAQISEEYAKRDFSHKIEISTGDEIEQLSISVNNMANSLLDFEKSRIALFRNLSHELKTPLTAIYGYAETIEKGCYTDLAMPLDTIKSESMRIKSILEDIILLTKIESNIELFEKKDFDLIELLIQAITTIESIAILQDIDIEFNPPKDKIFICGDKSKTLRAFINVLSNALKYTTNLIQIFVKIENSHCIITINDNGKGFDSDSLENIFKPFVKEKTNGSGLGLAVTKEILTKQNGTITVGNISMGATVQISLPIKDTSFNKSPLFSPYKTYL